MKKKTTKKKMAGHYCKQCGAEAKATKMHCGNKMAKR